MECDANYGITYYNATSQSLESPPNVTLLEWGRRLDDISRAKVVYGIADSSCCDQLGLLEPFVHQLAIKRNGRLAWYGWILRAEYGKDTVEIEAVDALLWLKKRILHEDITITADLAEIFLAIWLNVNAPDPINNITVTTNPTGVVETREALVRSFRFGWNIVKEMLDTGLDVTVFGKNILAGTISNSRPIELKLSDIEGDPRVVKDGTHFANRVIFDANESVVGIYPPGIPVPNSSYPLVEEVIKDAQVQDQTSADNAARARYEFSRRVPRLVNINDALTLSPYTSIALEDLIPGTLINLDTEGLCYATRESFRLGSLDVTVSGGNERIGIGLQPTGPFTNLSSAEDAVI
jgi:hypothetical protein